jgi:hypothetical protein
MIAGVNRNFRCLPLDRLYVITKGKAVSRYRPGVAQRVPGIYGPQIS